MNALCTQCIIGNSAASRYLFCFHITHNIYVTVSEIPPAAVAQVHQWNLKASP